MHLNKDYLIFIGGHFSRVVSNFNLYRLCTSMTVWVFHAVIPLLFFIYHYWTYWSVFIIPPARHHCKEVLSSYFFSFFSCQHVGCYNKKPLATRQTWSFCILHFWPMERTERLFLACHVFSASGMNDSLKTEAVLSLWGTRSINHLLRLVEVGESLYTCVRIPSLDHCPISHCRK